MKDTSQVRARALAPWWAAAGSALMLGVYAAAPATGRPLLGALTGMLATLGVVTGVHLFQPYPRDPWLALAVGLGVLNAADFGTALAGRGLHELSPVCAVLYPIGYVLLLLAIWRWAQAIGRAGLDTLLDVTILVVVGATVIVDMALNGHTMHGVATSTISNAVFSLVTLAALARLLTARLRRVPAFYLLVAAVAASFAQGVGTIAAQSYGWSTSLPIACGVFAYVFIACSAMHPTMVQVTLPGPGIERGYRRGLMMLPAVALPLFALLAPAVDRSPSYVVLGVGLLITATLTMVRTVRLLRAIEYRARHDQLTGLANRECFLSALDELIDVLWATHGTATLCWLDLDSFKAVNDARGHTAGDQLLVQVAHRLSAACGPTEVLARIGGDEFAILCRRPLHDRSWSELVDALGNAFATPFTLDDGSQHVVRVSTGVVLLSAATESAEQALADADIAMYAAKRSGGAKWRVFEDRLREDVVGRERLADEFVRALSDGQIEAYLQPVVSLNSGEVVGVEALARWVHPTRGVLAPDAFLDIAAERRLLVDLDRAVLRSALSALGREVAGSHGLIVGVNLSAESLSAPDLVDTILATLDTCNFPAQRLLVEITEHNAIVDEPVAQRSLHALADSGIRVAVDDFGTGYTALAYLTRFPVTTLKVDRALIADADSGSADLLGALVALGSSMGITMLAEGIESQAQAEMCQRLGFALGQGYHFARPQHSQDFLASQLLATLPRPRTAAAAERSVHSVVDAERQQPAR